MTLGVALMGAAGQGGGHWVGRLAVWIEVVVVVVDLGYSWVHATHIQE